MITVSLFGGLGNQMFQYAAGKALAERHSVPLLLDITGFRAHPERSFLLDRFRVPEAGKEGGASALSSGEGYFFAARRSARVARVLASAGLVWPRSVHDYREPHFHFDPTFKRLGAGTRLFGYFQSERYFEAIADRMRAYFIPVAPLSASAQTFVERITASALPVSLHVRRGDYLQPATRAVHGLLDEAYYRRALARMDATLGQTSELFVFSDDPEAASRVLNFLPPARMISTYGVERCGCRRACHSMTSTSP